MSDKRIRVMIADDHDMVRKGLTVLLEAYDDFELVADASDGDEAVQRCQELKPDVALVDLVMPVHDGVTAIQQINDTLPDVKIIALTNFQDDELIRSALQAGALSLLLKNVTMDELAKAIREAHAGESILAPEAAEILMRNDGKPQDFGLTPRELEVLALVVEGYNNKQIAQKLVISLSTVKKHVSGILTKLDVHNRAGAVTTALQHNLVEPPEDHLP